MRRIPAPNFSEDPRAEPWVEWALTVVRLESLSDVPWYLIRFQAHIQALYPDQFYDSFKSVTKHHPSLRHHWLAWEKGIFRRQLRLRDIDSV